MNFPHGDIWGYVHSRWWFSLIPLLFLFCDSRYFSLEKSKQRILFFSCIFFVIFSVRECFEWYVVKWGRDSCSYKEISNSRRSWIAVYEREFEGNNVCFKKSPNMIRPRVYVFYSELFSFFSGHSPADYHH